MLAYIIFNMKEKNVKSDYEILFIGGVYEEGKELEYLQKSRSSIQNAVNTHQWNIIKGLDNNNKTPVHILSARYLPTYPKYKDIIVRKNLWHHVDNANDENIGFINYKYIKNLCAKYQLEKRAKKWGSNTKNDKKEKLVFCYYTSVPQMSAAIKAKKKNPNLTTILIVPDIPDFLDLSKNKSFIKSLINKLKSKMAFQLLKQFDKYVLLTDAMTEKLGLNEKDCIVIEGMIDQKDCTTKEEIENKDFSKKSIVYAGSLHEKYGVKNFLEAIKLIKNEEVTFYIFGDGELKQEISEYSKLDSRVKFMGYQDREVVIEYQRKATALINPRGDQYEYVKYSFPSKNLEYLISGSPVICCKLPCMPVEYNEVYIFCNDNTPEQIAKTIIEVINKDEKELKEFAKKALEFAKQNKEKDIQCKKIINFMKSRG